MGFTVNTNLAASMAYNNLNNTQTALNNSLEKLSSGLRINKAADDAAGLAISQGMQSQIGGLGVAANNAQDGINVIQTAEGGLSQAQSILQRLRDLSVQAANDSNNTDSRNAIQTEATSLVSELTRISGSTNFGGMQLLDGKAGSNSDGKLNFQVGANGDAASQIGIDLSGSNVATIAKVLSANNTGESYTVTNPTTATSYTFTSTDENNKATNVTTGTIATGLTTASALATALNGDSKFAAKFSASVDTAGRLNVKSLSGDTVSMTASTDLTGPAAGLTGGLDFSTAAGAQASITALDKQITNVSTARATLGATQNRLTSAIQTINISQQNLTAASSRITDTDMASEMVKYTRSSILSQAGTAMLAQANQSNQGVLKLLQ